MDYSFNISHINQLYRQPGHNGSPADTEKDHAKHRPDGMPVDRVTLSKAAKSGPSAGPAMEKAVKSDQELTEEERQVVNDLKQRDLEVRAHEQAHMAAGGPVVQGGATYESQHGPDGKMYAVGGEVKIDVSPERTPEATIRKMQQIRKAALAPAQPSSTDRAVAAQAAQIEAQARMEKNEAAQTGHGADQPQEPETQATDPLQHSAPPAANGQQIDLIV